MNALPHINYFLFNNAGETAKFQCEAGGRPAPQITWIHNGKHLAEAAPNPRRHQIRNVIFIQNVTKSDIGD